MKKFLIFLIIFVLSIVIGCTLENILANNIFDLTQEQFQREHKFLHFLLIMLVLIPMLCLLSYFVDDNSEETPKEIEPKTDNPEESEIVVVTEIHGTKKIIKNGKVIYSEKLKADELQVYEKLKDKN